MKRQRNNKGQFIKLEELPKVDFTQRPIRKFRATTFDIMKERGEAWKSSPNFEKIIRETSKWNWIDSIIFSICLGVLIGTILIKIF